MVGNGRIEPGYTYGSDTDNGRTNGIGNKFLAEFKMPVRFFFHVLQNWNHGTGQGGQLVEAAVGIPVCIY